MNHRHLLPNEIDLLLDGEVGFGVAPLQAHVEECAACRGELEEARAVVRALERLPDVSPSPLFADRIMANVQVFEPWHVTALDTVRRWIPQSRPARILAGTGAGVGAMVLSAGALLLMVRLDVLRFILNILVDQAQTTAVSALRSVATDLLGQPAATTLGGAGPMGVLLAASVVVGTFVVASLGLRAIVVNARRRRG